MNSSSSVFIKSWNVDIRSLSAENQRSNADVGKIRDVATSMGAIIPLIGVGVYYRQHKPNADNAPLMYLPVMHPP